jgi:hypothetical protein
MIVEDQALIGMSLEASLEEAGFDVAGPFMSNAQALKWMENAARTSPCWMSCLRTAHP